MELLAKYRHGIIHVLLFLIIGINFYIDYDQYLTDQAMIIINQMSLQTDAIQTNIIKELMRTNG